MCNSLYTWIFCGLLSFGLISGCTLPTTVGLRSAGDPIPAGDAGVGGALGGTVGGVSSVNGALDADYGLTDRIGMAGSVGLLGGLVQGQIEFRFSSPREGRYGLTGIGGVGIMGGIGSFLIGPYAGAVGRMQAPSGGFFYAGLKVNPVWGRLSSSVWIQPAAGFSSRPAPVRWGVEGFGLLPVSGFTLISASGGVQGYVRLSFPINL